MLVKNSRIRKYLILQNATHKPRRLKVLEPKMKTGKRRRARIRNAVRKVRGN